MKIENRILRAAAHFANPDPLEQRQLCKAVWIEQRAGEIHVSATDGFIAAYFRIPTAAAEEVEKIGIASADLLDRRLRRRQDLVISSDGNAVTMITPAGAPHMVREKIGKKTVERLPLDMNDPEVITVDIPAFVQDRIEESRDDSLNLSLDDETPQISLPHRSIQRLGAAFEEIHGKNDTNLGYTITTAAPNRAAIIDIHNHRDYYGDWDNLTATFLIMPLSTGRRDQMKPPTIGLARLDGDWAVTLTGKHRTRTYSTHESRDDAIAAVRKLLDTRTDFNTTEELKPYVYIRSAGRDAALDHYDKHEDEQRAAEIKAKFEELETKELAHAAQNRLHAARTALHLAQQELDEAEAEIARDILENAQVAEEPAQTEEVAAPF